MNFRSKVLSPIKIILFRIAEYCLSRMGFHLIPKHFYQPIPEKADLNELFYQKQSDLYGLDIDDKAILSYLETSIEPWLSEFRGLFPLHKKDCTDRHQFHLLNGNYMAIDAHVYYATIRHLKPKHIIEIGGGYSSLLASRACQENHDSDGITSKLTIIEPYPNDQFPQGLIDSIELIEKKVQNVDLAVFTELNAGDILFIDSSHVLRSGGDVQYEYLEILPRLQSGVLVHIHDISLPKPYPKIYADKKLFWNEQYLLQAFLTFNSKIEIVWPGNYMMIKYPDKLNKIFPEFQQMKKLYTQSEASGFWIKIL